MPFLEKYPVAASEILHFPLMFPESMKDFRVPGIPRAKLEFLYEFGSSFGLAEGTVRTALSRMKKAGYVSATKAGATTRYRVSSLQIEIMDNFRKRKPRGGKGFVIAIYSFEKEQARERALIRSLLEYGGFIRFAQNSYIASGIDEKELRAKLGKTGLSSNAFLFDVNKIKDEDLAKMAAAWKIPERRAFLKSFFDDIEDYLSAGDGSDVDVFNRQAGAWVAYIVHVQSTEPPLPESLLPEDYAYSSIADYLRKSSMRHGKKMLRHYLAKNK